jgi:hypothetical protein
LIVEGFEGEKLIEGLTVTLARRDDVPPNLWDGSKAGEIVDQAEFKISLTIVLRNGDRFRADVLMNSWRVAASFGEPSIPVELIRRIAVQARR